MFDLAPIKGAWKANPYIHRTTQKQRAKHKRDGKLTWSGKIPRCTHVPSDRACALVCAHAQYGGADVERAVAIARPTLSLCLLSTDFCEEDVDKLVSLANRRIFKSPFSKLVSTDRKSRLS